MPHTGHIREAPPLFFSCRSHLPPPPRCGPTDLKPKTRHHYQSLLRQHILPAWQTVPLAKIAFEDLSQWGAAIR